MFLDLDHFDKFTETAFSLAEISFLLRLTLDYGITLPEEEKLVYENILVDLSNRIEECAKTFRSLGESIIHGNRTAGGGE